MALEHASDVPDTVARHTTRGYQQELLRESLRRNVVIALDTGSGKTHIAILRMKHETERNTDKISWFLAPTVALIDQQRDAIASAIPVAVGLISGNTAPDQWKDARLWAKVLKDNRIVVSTPQVLLDALSHGYVKLGIHISLIVFDEAHHAVSKHPYNEIMQRFYHPLPVDQPKESPLARPAILGLSASPIYGGNIEKAFRELESNLDSVVLSSRYNREELATYVHRPEFKYVSYSTPDELDPVDCHALASLQATISQMNIEDDPYVISLRSRLAKLPTGKERDRVDQRLSRTLDKKDSFSHKGMRDFERTAQDVCTELGPWAANWYITSVLERARTEAKLHTGVMASWQNAEKMYLLNIIGKVQLYPISYDPDVIRAGISDKVHCLVRSLLVEEETFRQQDELYSGIVFVTRRDAVITLGKILASLPEMSEKFRVGCLLGKSSNFKRHAFKDISRTLLKEGSTKTLNDFRAGEKNLLVSTSVAEEGLDIQACGSVVRFDPPPNMVAWAQSRGRARRRRSTFVVLLDERELTSHNIHNWQDLERVMIEYYKNQARPEEEEPDDEISENDLKYQVLVEETGALLTLQNAMAHLHHFCAVLPQTAHAPQLPLFDLDPPDYVEGWHSLDPRPGTYRYEGPWGASCTLPRQVPADLRQARTGREYPTKRAAYNYAAFFAYYRLYLYGLVNDHLLPHTDFIKPDEDGAVKLLLKDIEKRAGLAKVPIQMDPWLAPEGPETWWYNEAEIEGLPRLFMFTRRELPQLNEAELPVLFVPGQGTVTVDVVSTSEQVTDGGVIAAAQQYTRRMFATLHEKRMDLDKFDFCYLFLPMDETPSESMHRQRREWMGQRLSSGVAFRSEGENRANAYAFGKQFGYPVDIALVRGNDKWDKVLRFVGWHEGPISQEEEEELRDRYDGVPGFEITYPLIIAEVFPRRANFLTPLETDDSGLGGTYPFLLVPKLATIELATPEDVQFAFLLPSVLRFLSFTVTTQSMRNTLLSDTPSLYSIPFSLLRTAITTPGSQEQVNYERLETLGDCVLKYLTSIQFFSQYPLWHEGYLARRKDHAVNNQQLAKKALEKGIQAWMIRDRFSPRKWRPKYSSDPVPLSKSAQEAEQAERAEAEGAVAYPESAAAATSEDAPRVDTQGGGAEGTPGAQAKPKKKKKKQAQELSTKMLADVVEALLGASYEHGGFDLATECARKFGLGLDHWDPVSVCVENVLSRVEPLDNLPPELSLVETMLGYKFSRPTLLVEALTHGSYTGDLGTVSYERLEFVGDAVLDMIVTDTVYHTPGHEYKPGHMHIFKESLVNRHLLAFMCLNTYVDIDASMPAWNAQDGVVMSGDTQRIYLYRCMLHSSPRVLDDLNVTFTRYEKQGAQIRRALLNDDIYPWAALTSLQAPKFISDMFESVLGAVFLDSHGNLDIVRGVLDRIGFTDVMRRVISGEVDVLHPMSRLHIWRAKHQRDCEVVVEKAGGKVTCFVKIDGEEICRATESSHGQTSLLQVRFAAAEGAIRKLEVKEQEVVEDIAEAEEDDFQLPEGW